jgi:nucleotide-binding universal stress UspA family protein
MNEGPGKVLLATDGSPDAILAARRAAGLALAFGSELHVVHVIPVSQPYTMFGETGEGPSILEEDSGKARGLLDGEVERIEGLGGKVAKVHLRTGEPDAEIVALGEEIGAGTIVVGSRGLGPLARMPIGSVSSSVAGHAHCPVLVVRDYDTDEEGRPIIRGKSASTA